MHVHAPLLIQLIHRGAALRKRCLASYPSIEFTPHEKMVQNGLAQAAASSKWERVPKMMAPQEVSERERERVCVCVCERERAAAAHSTATISTARADHTLHPHALSTLFCSARPSVTLRHPPLFTTSAHLSILPPTPARPPRPCPLALPSGNWPPPGHSPRRNRTRRHSRAVGLQRCSTRGDAQVQDLCSSREYGGQGIHGDVGAVPAFTRTTERHTARVCDAASAVRR